jgi:hypothetical protein
LSKHKCGQAKDAIWSKNERDFSEKKKVVGGVDLYVPNNANQLGSSSHFHRRQREKTKPPSKSYMGVSNATCLAGYSIKCIETRHGTKQKWVCQMILPEMTFWGLGKNPAVKKNLQWLPWL